MTGSEKRRLGNADIIPFKKVKKFFQLVIISQFAKLFTYPSVLTKQMIDFQM